MYIPAWPSLSPLSFANTGKNEDLPFPLQSSSAMYFYVARNGIYHLTRALGLDKAGTVLAPDYHHGNEISAMRAARACIRYYPIRKNLDADLDALDRLCRQIRPRVLYVTHFIGWPQPMEDLRALCRKEGILLVEDCALSFMSTFQGRPLGTFGDYSVFCLYKSLPLPNGGVLAFNDSAPSHDLKELKLSSCSKTSITARTAELMLQWIRLHSETAGRALFAFKRWTGRMMSAGRIERCPVGDTGFNLSAVNVGMSPICHSLISRFQYDWIKESRRRNFRLLQERLQGKIALLEKTLTEDVCPLFFPLLVRDKQIAVRKLWERGIQTIEFWNHGDAEAQSDKSDAQFLRCHLLEVPIHQDVTPERAAYIADQIIELRLGLPA